MAKSAKKATRRKAQKRTATSVRGPGEIDIEVGARVRARRLEISMSQERLAELLGVTFQQVQKYEKGVNRIATGRLVEISRALDTSLLLLLPPWALESACAGNDGEIGATLAKLNAAGRARLSEFAKTLAANPALANKGGREA